MKHRKSTSEKCAEILAYLISFLLSLGMLLLFFFIIFWFLFGKAIILIYLFSKMGATTGTISLGTIILLLVLLSD